MVERLLYALLGAFMGSIIGLGALLGFSGDINWLFVSFSAARVCVARLCMGRILYRLAKRGFHFLVVITCNRRFCTR